LKNNFNVQSKSRNTNSNQSIKNLKASTLEKSSEIPVVEFDFSSSTIEHGLPEYPVQPHKPSMVSRKSSLKKYLNTDTLIIKNQDENNPIISIFTPQSEFECIKNTDSDIISPRAPSKIITTKSQQECKLNFN